MRKTHKTTDKEGTSELDHIGSVEEGLFTSRLPSNCQVPICGQPAYKKDLDGKVWCEEHKERGRFANKETKKK
jgi:hypothetical protein